MDELGLNPRAGPTLTEFSCKFFRQASEKGTEKLLRGHTYVQIIRPNAWHDMVSNQVLFGWSIQVRWYSWSTKHLQGENRTAYTVWLGNPKKEMTWLWKGTRDRLLEPIYLPPYIHSKQSHPIYFISVSILSSHLYLLLPSDSKFPVSPPTPHTPWISDTCPTHRLLI